MITWYGLKPIVVIVNDDNPNNVRFHWTKPMGKVSFIYERE